jgi:hypothetical protein
MSEPPVLDAALDDLADRLGRGKPQTPAPRTTGSTPGRRPPTWLHPCPPSTTPPRRESSGSPAAAAR